MPQRRVRDVLDTNKTRINTHHHRDGRTALRCLWMSSGDRNTHRSLPQTLCVPIATQQHWCSAICGSPQWLSSHINSVPVTQPSTSPPIRRFDKAPSTFCFLAPSTFWRKSEWTGRKANYIVNTETFSHSIHRVRVIWEVYPFTFGPCPFLMGRVPYSQGRAQTYCEAEDGLELLILWPSSSLAWNERSSCSWLARLVLMSTGQQDARAGSASMDRTWFSVGQGRHSMRCSCPWDLGGPQCVRTPFIFCSF